MSTATMHKGTAKAIARRLMGAADLIEERGWTRGASAKKDGKELGYPFEVGNQASWARLARREADCFCISGAVNVTFADRTMGEMFEVFGLLDEEVQVRYGCEDFVTWNDEEAKSKRQVVAMIRRVARRFAQAQGLDIEEL